IRPGGRVRQSGARDCAQWLSERRGDPPRWRDSPASEMIRDKGREMPDLKPPPKNSVALSGVVAGNTALCTVGRAGNDLHYRGYDILDIADSCDFEEIAYLLVHERLPDAGTLAAYKRRLAGLRDLPGSVKSALEAIPATANPMDVMRTGVSMLGSVEPEG